jgi:hypothetical protein
VIYQFIERSPFAHRVGKRIIGPKGSDLSAVPFLHPDQVDAASKVGMTPMTEGYPVDPAAVPKAVLWESKDKPLPDVTMLHGVNIVSERVKDIIERFEPGVHQFLPVDLYRPKQDKPFAHAYWLVVCKRIDSVDAEKTTFSRSRNRLWNVTPDGYYVFSLAAIGSSNLWIDPDTRNYMYCSGILGDALKENNITGLFLRERNVI